MLVLGPKTRCVRPRSRRLGRSYRVTTALAFALIPRYGVEGAAARARSATARARRSRGRSSPGREGVALAAALDPAGALEVDVMPDLELRLDHEQLGLAARVDRLELLDPPLALGVGGRLQHLHQRNLREAEVGRARNGLLRLVVTPAARQTQLRPPQQKLVLRLGLVGAPERRGVARRIRQRRRG